MSIMIQVRNVPDSLHKELVRRAKARGQPLTAYIQEILEREVARSARQSVLDRLRSLPEVHLDRPIADFLREAREDREDD